LVVLDPGSRFVRALVVDTAFGTPRIAHFQTFDFGSPSPEGNELIEEELAALFAAAGPHERVLVLPQYRAISQVVDIPPVSPEETQATLAREARRLSGLEEGALTYDAIPLKPFGRLSDPHWLTLCRREELDLLLARFASLPESPGAEPPRLAQVTTSGQALFAGATVLLPAGGHGVLVDLRVNNSVVAIVVNGQGVNTTTIPIGTRQFSEALGLPTGRDWVRNPMRPRWRRREPRRREMACWKSGWAKSGSRFSNGSKTTRTAGSRSRISAAFFAGWGPPVRASSSSPTSTARCGLKPGKTA